MPQVRLTDITLRGLQGSEQYITYFDTQLPAFGVRCGKRSKTFVIVRGKNRERVTVGKYPQMSLADARIKAKKLLANEPEPKSARITFEKAKEEFLEENYRGSTSEWPGIVRSIFNKHFRAFNEKKLAEITDEDIEDALSAIEGQSAKLHAFRVLRTFFNWSLKPPRRYLRHSPMNGYDPPGTDKKRSRVLTDEELVAIWNASGKGSRRVFRLLILWGTRSKETCALERIWAHDGVLTIPGFQDGKRITKNGRDHAIPILPLAQLVLVAGDPADDARLNSGFYFPGQKEGKPLARGSLAELRRDIQKDSDTKDWGAHDLRRTFRSNMARLKLPRELCEILLNHAPAVLDQIYDRYTYLEEKREALARYEAFMVKLLGSGKT